MLDVDIDDVIEYVHKDLKSLPDFTTLYRKYLKQRWDVYDLDFTQDKIDPDVAEVTMRRHVVYQRRT